MKHPVHVLYNVQWASKLCASGTALWANREGCRIPTYTDVGYRERLLLEQFRRHNSILYLSASKQKTHLHDLEKWISEVWVSGIAIVIAGVKYLFFYRAIAVCRRAWLANNRIKLTEIYYTNRYWHCGDSKLLFPRSGKYSGSRRTKGYFLTSCTFRKVCLLFDTFELIKCYLAIKVSSNTYTKLACTCRVAVPTNVDSIIFGKVQLTHIYRFSYQRNIIPYFAVTFIFGLGIYLFHKNYSIFWREIYAWSKELWFMFVSRVVPTVE